MDGGLIPVQKHYDAESRRKTMVANRVQCIFCGSSVAVFYYQHVSAVSLDFCMHLWICSLLPLMELFVLLQHICHCQIQQGAIWETTSRPCLCTLLTSFLLPNKTYTLLSCAQQSRGHSRALGSAITFSFSQWLENHKRGQKMSPDVTWLADSRGSSEQLVNLPVKWASALPLHDTIIAAGARNTHPISNDAWICGDTCVRTQPPDSQPSPVRPLPITLCL